MVGLFLPESGGLRTSSTSIEARGREVAGVKKSSGGPDQDPNRPRFSIPTRSVTRALRTGAVFVLQVVVVTGIRKVIDWLIP